MAEIVLGLCTSHSPLMTTPAEFWQEYAKFDPTLRELMYEGVAVPYADAVRDIVTPEVRDRHGSLETFQRQFQQCQDALAALAVSLEEARPDITIVVTNDQDEWLYDWNMPAVAVYWGDSVPLIPWSTPDGAPDHWKYLVEGYGDVPMEVPVPGAFGRHTIEYLMDHDFDPSYMSYTAPSYGGTVARRYPAASGGEIDLVGEKPQRPVGLPHGAAFVVKRLFHERPGPLLPVLQNTCYPPTNIRPSRAYDLGVALAGAIREWPEDVRVAVVGSGGLSHFVVDEELDHRVLDALVTDDAETLRSLPREHLYSASSEILNWVTIGGAMSGADLKAEVVDYVPVYRTEAGTGGGWGFMRWQ